MSISKGVFIAPTVRSFGYSAKILLRNTLRNPFDPLMSEKKKGIKFTSASFDELGQRIIDSTIEGVIPFDSYFEVPANKNAAMLMAITEIDTDSKNWFEQEHEILYEHPLTKSRPSVIYDQLPFRQIDNYAPIILLNHKSYISKNITAILMFSNYRGEAMTDLAPQSMDLRFYNCDGRLLKAGSYQFSFNSAICIDVRKELNGLVILSDEPEMITVTARGGNSIFAIQTGIINDSTHNMALEHSLAPTYFVTQNMSEVRSRALIFQ